jgi:DNA modification methylase
MWSKLYNGDCLDILPAVLKEIKKPVIVTDPPFNISYHYGKYKDNLPEKEYYEWLKKIFSFCPFVVIHYAESLFKIAHTTGIMPEKVCSWVYNSNTAKQHRDIAFYDIKPDFNRVKQPYKNPNDKRIKERIARGLTGCKLYDWWNVNQVKNVSKDKTGHPCQMPVEVMKNIVGILPDGITVLDPFMGSGTTGLACKELDVPFIGIELDEEYFNIARVRINGT